MMDASNNEMIACTDCPSTSSSCDGVVRLERCCRRSPVRTAVYSLGRYLATVVRAFDPCSVGDISKGRFAVEAKRQYVASRGGQRKYRTERRRHVYI